jgi:hypothetical protein
MKTTASILATAALLAGIAVANAQTPSTPGSESQKTLDNAGGAERNPDGSTGGSKTNPSPEGTTGEAPRQPANPKAMSPATDPANPDTQRNPDGSPGGSPANPSPR